MKTYTFIVLAGILSACAVPTPPRSAEDVMREYGCTREQFDARVQAQYDLLQAQKARSLEEQGGYGPPPTRAGIEAAVDFVRESCKNPSSFELEEILGDTRTSTLWNENRPVHGWQVDIYFRATNSYGGVVPGHASVLVYKDRPIYSRW